MKNITVAITVALIFLLAGTLLPVSASVGASNSALINKSEEILRLQSEGSDHSAPVLAVKPIAHVVSESETAAHLTGNTKQTEDTRVQHLRVYLSAKDSPLTGEADHLVKQADRYNLDWKFVAAISGVESTFGKFIPEGSYNGWGWGIPTGANSGIGFGSWEDAIAEISKGLRTNYMNRGALTIEQIGRIYAASPAWSWKVRFFMDQIENFTPNSPELLSVTL